MSETEAMIRSKELMEVLKHMRLRGMEALQFSFIATMDDGKKLLVEIGIKVD